MTQEIIEGNKIIAEFMGGKFKKKTEHPHVFPDGVWVFGDIGVPALQYHTSWDELVPVVEKIEKLPVSTWVKIYGDSKLGECEISNENCDHDENGHWKPIVSVQKISKIEAVWIAVVQFIKWYKSQAV